MKARLTFKLPKDQEDYDRANAAMSLCSFIHDFDNYLRGQYKYAEEPDDIEKIREKWYEIMRSENIDMDKIYS